METDRNAVGADVLPLVVEGLSKQYRGGLWANRDISFSARAGEVLGILGPNGAGKTTLVRQITTELMPTSGSLKVFGIDVVSSPIEVKYLMGIVPQEAMLHEHLTVHQTFRIFGKLRGVPASEARHRADEVISDLRLEEHRNVMARNLSGGLKRRVIVGLAVLGRPKLMVLDEPTTGLDPQSRRDLWALLRRYREDGAAILLTTHYMEEAEALCDRVGIIQRGRLLALDTVPNLKASHGYQFKAVYSEDTDEGETKTIYGADDRELFERVHTIGARSVAISPTTLEDVYLALTDGKEGLGDVAD